MADPLPQTDSMQKSPVAVAATLVQQHGNGADNATGNTAEGMSQVTSSSNATVMDENFPAALNLIPAQISDLPQQEQRVFP